MRIIVTTVIFFLVLNFISCSSGNKEKKQAVIKKPEITRDQQIQNNIDSLKKTALDGDLIVRMNDNMISYRVQSLNETDKSFSHSGIIIIRNNIKMVCNIEPEEKGADTVRFEPIDSFINPKQNLACGLFRYDLSDSEKPAFLNQLENYHTNKIHFDMRYDLNTDDYIYCSEMIYKSLRQATHNRISIKLSQMPQRMIPLMKLFLKKYKLTEREIQERKFVTIDNLYLIKECKEIMRFPLKYFPGQ
ncbi:MAG: YiiX/YebB-like N1pC/P60 family cysteine hydrolase [Ginsengibacter sp.]